MALRITGQAIASQRMWHKEAPADDISVFKGLQLLNPKYHMINFYICMHRENRKLEQER